MSLLEALRQPHALYVLEHAQALVPGIHRMVACFYHDQKTQLWQLEAKDSAPNPVLLNKEDLERIGHYRHRKREEWLSIEELEIDFEKTNNFQKEVFDELENHVLILSFKNDLDRGYDCIFFYFNKDASNFGLRRKDDVLTTDSKAVILNLLKQSLNLVIEQRRSFEKEVNQYKSYLQKLSVQYKNAKERLDEYQQGRAQRMLAYAQQIVKELAVENNYDILLTNAAKEAIRIFDGGREQLPKILSKAAQFAIYSSPGQDLVTIEDWHLDFEKEEQQVAQSEVEQPVDVRYRKTFVYLNRLEEAARLAYSKRQKLTSKNVGQAMPQPVSAPAISDALNNHRKFIFTLFDLYPNKWSLIRKEFRPITNLLIKKDEHRDAV